MSEEKKKTIYVPKSSAKLREGTPIGTVFNISFKVDELIEFAKANKNAKGYLNLSCLPRRAESDYGDTHSVTLDQWVPKPKTEGEEASRPARTTRTPSRAAATPAPATGADEAGDDIPF